MTYTQFFTIILKETVSGSLPNRILREQAFRVFSFRRAQGK